MPGKPAGLAQQGGKEKNAMTENQEKAMMECGRILAKAGLASAMLKCRNQALELLPIMIMLSPGIAKCAAIGFADEVGPREMLTLDDTQSSEDQSLTE